MEDLAKLFQIGDEEHKGFIIRRDMQRLQGELSLSADELESVFDSLDSEARGYLTLDKFLMGYNQHRTGSVKDFNANICEVETDKSSLIPTEVSSIMSDLTSNMFLSKSTLAHLQELSLLISDGQLLSEWEKLLFSLNQDMKRTQDHVSQMESLLSSRESQHKTYVRKLFEDMETQLREEKERVVEEESGKLKVMRDQMGNELDRKAEDVKQLVEVNNQLEVKLAEVTREETKYKNLIKQMNCDQEFYACQVANLQKATVDLQDELENIRTQAQTKNQEEYDRGYRTAQTKTMFEQDSFIEQLKMLRRMQSILSTEHIDQLALSCRFES